MDIMEKNKDPIEQAINMLWSDYSDVDYVVRDMGMRDYTFQRHILKMAFKHLRDDLYKCHQILCKLQDEREGLTDKGGRT